MCVSVCDCRRIDFPMAWSIMIFQCICITLYFVLLVICLDTDHIWGILIKKQNKSISLASFSFYLFIIFNGIVQKENKKVSNNLSKILILLKAGLKIQVVSRSNIRTKHLSHDFNSVLNGARWQLGGNPPPSAQVPPRSLPYFFF